MMSRLGFAAGDLPEPPMDAIKSARAESHWAGVHDDATIQCTILKKCAIWITPEHVVVRGTNGGGFTYRCAPHSRSPVL